MSDHIDDAEEFYGEDVYSNLGDPVEIGEALNAIHHPLIGRLWLLSKVLLVFAVALFLFESSKAIGIQNDQNKFRNSRIKTQERTSFDSGGISMWINEPVVVENNNQELSAIKFVVSIERDLYSRFETSTVFSEAYVSGSPLKILYGSVETIGENFMNHTFIFDETLNEVETFNFTTMGQTLIYEKGAVQ